MTDKPADKTRVWSERFEEPVTDLVKRAGLKQDAAKESFAEMSYNQLQLYAYEYLGEPVATDEVPRYDDATATRPGTAKPVFQT